MKMCRRCKNEMMATITSTKTQARRYHCSVCEFKVQLKFLDKIRRKEDGKRRRQ
jgi:transposase-like protein